MCFYSQGADWYASVVETDDRVSDGTVRCDECRRKIGPGQGYEHTDQREHEECRRCQDECSDWYEENHPDCAEGKHHYGEEYQHDICEECLKFLAAIQYVEADEGCAPSESRPPLGELLEALWDSDSAVAYIDRASADFPELAMNGYLDRMYYYTHEYDREFKDRWDDDDLVKVEEHGGEA